MSHAYFVALSYRVFAFIYKYLEYSHMIFILPFEFSWCWSHLVNKVQEVPVTNFKSTYHFVINFYSKELKCSLFNDFDKSQLNKSRAIIWINRMSKIELSSEQIATKYHVRLFTHRHLSLSQQRCAVASSHKLSLFIILLGLVDFGPSARVVEKLVLSDV